MGFQNYNTLPSSSPSSEEAGRVDAGAIKQPRDMFVFAQKFFFATLATCTLLDIILTIVGPILYVAHDKQHDAEGYLYYMTTGIAPTLLFIQSFPTLIMMRYVRKGLALVKDGPTAAHLCFWALSVFSVLYSVGLFGFWVSIIGEDNWTQVPDEWNTSSSDYTHTQWWSFHEFRQVCREHAGAMFVLGAMIVRTGMPLFVVGANIIFWSVKGLINFARWLFID
eukprot:TRINITY_DN6051_c4_g1_i1.p1 TRINITY_DN6051_c4_g1~~TRINITY_DN6051_c4_g1_i1.p1  ORF type:complete len:223 (-),score=33.83 TRINITY_DN6051_c4_g1_i1:137-805(-)